MKKYIILISILLLTACTDTTGEKMNNECRDKGGVLLYIHAQGVVCFKKDVFINVQVVE